jgi:23S rRNA (guanosine2251-2'-O)-methyltransferase
VNGRKVVNARPAERQCWLYGINAVARRLAVQPASIRALELLRGESPRRAQLARAARQAGIPVRDADQATLRRLTGCDTHQGVAALAEAYRYQDLDVVVAAQPGPVLVLDQIQDPHNLGALVRTAAAVGMTAVLIPRHGAAGVSPAVEKVAAGAVNDVPICQTTNIRNSLLALRDHGYWSIALTPHTEQNLFALEIPARPVLVLGGETGIRPLVDRTCDLRASIPLRSGIESLNASVAGAVAMYEVARRLQRLDSPGGCW